MLQEAGAGVGGDGDEDGQVHPGQRREGAEARGCAGGSRLSAVAWGASSPGKGCRSGPGAGPGLLLPLHDMVDLPIIRLPP